jgi:23S rRNA pseudouridine1911/1915/1917 synthase
MKLTEAIMYEDDDIIVINKPSGMLSIPDREGKDISLKKILQDKYEQVFTIHRLDKDTSGLIVFGKNAGTHQELSRQFEQRETKKIYQGLVLGSPSQKSGQIDAPIAEHPVKKGMMTVYRNGKESLTDYEVLKDYSIYSWMQFRIHTGRTHQIRVHMKLLGHPVVCDELYGDGKPVLLSSIKPKYKLSKDQEEEQPLLNRLALHAYSLGLTLMNGEAKEFTAPLPKDLRATLQQLDKRNKGKSEIGGRKSEDHS